jgi:hypothetical protein
MSVILFNLHLKWLATKNTRRRVYPKDMILILFEREMIIRAIFTAVLCFRSQGQQWECPLAAIIGDDVPLSPPIVDVL